MYEKNHLSIMDIVGSSKYLNRLSENKKLHLVDFTQISGQRNERQDTHASLH